MKPILSVALLFAMSLPQVAVAGIGFRQLTTIQPVAVQRGTDRIVQLRSNFTLDDSYATFFDRDPPARVCVGVSRLPKGSRIEIEAIAYLGPSL